MRSYLGLTQPASRAGGASTAQVRDLQHDLRALGYLHHGIDGGWGGMLDQAIRSIRLDLCDPGHTPAIAAANRAGKVVAAPPGGPATCEPALGACIAALMDDAGVAKLPSSADAAGDNRRIMAAFRAMRSTTAPVPFLAAMFVQESGGRHYVVPTPSDGDGFVVVGLDRNDAARPDRITSRGYGLGQYTLFHHPPTAAEVSAFIDDPAGNVQTAIGELREKFDGFVRSTNSGRRADDSYAEHPVRKLTMCTYAPGDPRYLTDCRNCALAAGTADLRQGTPVFPGSGTTWGSTQYYPNTGYRGVPRRAAFPCDWPYAARRYNGSGINSFHYQARILINLLI